MQAKGDTKSSNPFGRKSVRRPETGTRLSALEIHENIRAPAVEELERPASSLFFSSLAAGMLIGFSFLAMAFVAHYAPDPYKHPLSALAYPVGFMFVIMGRSELFTENTLEPVIPLLHKRDAKTLRQLLRMWGILIAGNLLGALLFAWVLGRTSMIEPVYPRPSPLLCGLRLTGHAPSVHQLLTRRVAVHCLTLAGDVSAQASLWSAVSHRGPAAAPEQRLGRAQYPQPDSP